MSHLKKLCSRLFLVSSLGAGKNSYKSACRRLWILFLLPLPLFSAPPTHTPSLPTQDLALDSESSQEKLSRYERTSLQTLYNSLDPKSITQLLAFYRLYPHTAEGKQSLRRAWTLLSGESHSSDSFSIKPFALFPSFQLSSLIALITKGPDPSSVELSPDDLAIIEKLSERLVHHKKKGHFIWTEKELLALPSEEVDLARALLIYQFGEKEEHKKQIRQYEATLDLMALQILARLPANPSAREKIGEISHLIFHEMQFRFPPPLSLRR